MLSKLFLYIAVAELFVIFIGFSGFIVARALDKKKIQSLTKEAKEERAKNIRNEIARLSLVRQIEENSRIIKDLRAETKRIKSMNLKDTLEKL